MGSWGLSSQEIRQNFCVNIGKSVGFRGVVESKFIIISFSFLSFFVLMELVGKLRFLNEYGNFGYCQARGSIWKIRR